MVVSRNGYLTYPCIREITFIAGVSPSSKAGPKRVAELPTLQYRAIDVKTGAGVGPNRRPQRPTATTTTSTTHYQPETIPRRNYKKSNVNFHTSLDTDANQNYRSPRRVRFTLPSKDGATNTNSRTAPQRSSTSASGEAETLPLRRQNHKTFSRFSDFSDFSRPTESVEGRRGVVCEKQRRVYDDYASFLNSSTTSVLVTASPGVRNRVHPTGRYIRGTLSPTASALPHAVAASPGCQALLTAARDGDDHLLRDLLSNGVLAELSESDLNAVDFSGRTILSYIASNGSIDLLEQILHLPGLDPNKPDNEGNTPLHFAAQAGQIECLNCMLSRCRGIEIDARNTLGFTPLMKAALQGRNKCAKLLLFAGANPTLRDNGRGFRADQWARFCGRYVCADVIEKHARQRLLERSTSYGNWGGENELGARVLMGKVIPMPTMPQQQPQGLKSKLRKVFRTSSGPTADTFSSARLVTQLTSAALCASSPVLPSGNNVPPVVKSLIRPLTVPRLQITLVNNNAEFSNNNNVASNNGVAKTAPIASTTTNQKGKEEEPPVIKPARTKKKK